MNDYIYCSKCGNKLSKDSKYCNKCGQVTSNEDERKFVYDGIIHKCPNCGEVLTSFVAICPACGYELNNQKVNNSLSKFATEVNDIEKLIFDNQDEQKLKGSKKFWWIILNIYLLGIPLILKRINLLYLPKKKVILTKEEKALETLIENYSFPMDRESIVAALIFCKDKMSFISNKTLDQKNMYWLNLWNDKASQLKQKADILFPKDSIVNQNYNDIVNIKNKCQNQIKRKLLINIIIVILIFILLVIIVNNTNVEPRVDYNSTFTWEDSELFKALPEPDTNQGKINYESLTYLSIDLYNVNEDDFEEYVKKCRSKGYENDLIKNETNYSARKDQLKLSISYNQNKKIITINLNKGE